jgi:uncharacterized protein YxeA
MLDICIMKRVIAVVLLIIYGSVSVSAAMVMHQCGNKQIALVSHQKSCNSKDASTNCCSNQQSQCAVESYDNPPVLTASKASAIDSELSPFYSEVHSRNFFFSNSSYLSFQNPQHAGKIPLYLYNRMLLI